MTFSGIAVIMYLQGKENKTNEREVTKMYTRCFERGNEVINISEYGFEWYVDNKVARTGLVENLEEDIERLINEGFEEVV